MYNLLGLIIIIINSIFKKNVFRIKFLPADYLLEEAEISFAENLLVVNFSNYDFEQYDKYRILAADEYIQLKSNYKLLEGLDIYRPYYL